MNNCILFLVIILFIVFYNKNIESFENSKIKRVKYNKRRSIIRAQTDLKDEVDLLTLGDYKDNICDNKKLSYICPNQTNKEKCLQCFQENKDIVKETGCNLKSDIDKYCDRLNECNYNSDCPGDQCCGPYQCSLDYCGDGSYDVNDDDLICINSERPSSERPYWSGNECRRSNGECTEDPSYCSKSLYSKCNNIRMCRNSDGLCGINGVTPAPSPKKWEPHDTQYPKACEATGTPEDRKSMESINMKYIYSEGTHGMELEPWNAACCNGTRTDSDKHKKLICRSPTLSYSSDHDLVPSPTPPPPPLPGEEYCNSSSIYKPCATKNFEEGSNYIQYNILFPKYNKIGNNTIQTKANLKQQNVIICIPKNKKKPTGGYPFVINFEFMDSEGCYENYKNVNGPIHGMVGLENKDSYGDENLKIIYDIYSDLLDSGIAIIFFPDYYYDMRFNEDCNYGDFVGKLSNEYVGRNTDNSCFNYGNNPDVYLFNMLIWNIYYWKQKPENKPNPTTINSGGEYETTWPININKNGEIIGKDTDNLGNDFFDKQSEWYLEYTQMSKIDDFTNIHLDLNKMCLSGYSAGTLFVSRLINDFSNLKIWKTLEIEPPKIKLAILINGGGISCYNRDMFDEYIIKEGSEGCYQNSNESTDPYNTNFCKAHPSANNWGFTGCCGTEPDMVSNEDTCTLKLNELCGTMKTTVFQCAECTKRHEGELMNQGKCTTENIADFCSGVELSLTTKTYDHPPTLMVSTLCDLWSDKNWPIRYKEAYRGTEVYENIIGIPSQPGLETRDQNKWEREVTNHGPVESQKQPLKEWIKYIMFFDENIGESKNGDIVYSQPSPQPNIPPNWDSDRECREAIDYNCGPFIKLGENCSTCSYQTEVFSKISNACGSVSPPDNGTCNAIYESESINPNPPHPSENCKDKLESIKFSKELKKNRPEMINDVDKCKDTTNDKQCAYCVTYDNIDELRNANCTTDQIVKWCKDRKSLNPNPSPITQ